MEIGSEPLFTPSEYYGRHVRSGYLICLDRESPIFRQSESERTNLMFLEYNDSATTPDGAFLLSLG